MNIWIFQILLLGITIICQSNILPWTDMNHHVPPTNQESLNNYRIKFLWNHYKTMFNSMPQTVNFTTFENNVKSIHKHNLRFLNGSTSFEMSVNEFTGMSKSDFNKRLGLRLSNKVPTLPHIDYIQLKKISSTLPKVVDWRHDGHTSKVKNQGACGSCWAFSVTGAIEGQVKRMHNHLTTLSEQQLVDCSYENMGCNGGSIDVAFNYVHRVNGIESDIEYPYVSGYTQQANEDCLFDVSKTVAKVRTVVDIESGNAEQLMLAVANEGPISIAINAAPSSFMAYHRGVYKDSDCFNGTEHLNHAVLLVGYNVLADIPYWIVKNSWGENWGESGFVRIAQEANMCGLTNMASYPIIY